MLMLIPHRLEILFASFSRDDCVILTNNSFLYSCFHSLQRNRQHTVPISTDASDSSLALGIGHPRKDGIKVLSGVHQNKKNLLEEGEKEKKEEVVGM